MRDAVLGALLVVEGALIGRHVSNLLVFRRVNRGGATPETGPAAAGAELTGRVTMTHSLSLVISMYQYLVVAAPMTFLAAWRPEPAVVGGAGGAWILILVHVGWIVRHRRALARTAAAPGGPPGVSVEAPSRD